MVRGNDYRTSAVKSIEKHLKQSKKAIVREMLAKARRIRKKGTLSLPIGALIQNADSNSKTPKLKMFAVTNHPSSNGWPQSMRTFETLEELINPDNQFNLLDQLIKVFEEDFSDVALLNQTAKVVYAADRMLQKVLKE